MFHVALLKNAWTDAKTDIIQNLKIFLFVIWLMGTWIVGRREWFLN